MMFSEKRRLLNGKININIKLFLKAISKGRYVDNDIKLRTSFYFGIRHGKERRKLK